MNRRDWLEAAKFAAICGVWLAVLAFAVAMWLLDEWLRTALWRWMGWARW